MEMLDKIVYKFFGWIDDITRKIDDALTFDFTNFSKRKKKKKWKKKVGRNKKLNH